MPKTQLNYLPKQCHYPQLVYRLHKFIPIKHTPPHNIKMQLQYQLSNYCLPHKITKSSSTTIILLQTSTELSSINIIKCSSTTLASYKKCDHDSVLNYPAPLSSTHITLHMLKKSSETKNQPTTEWIYF